VTGGGTTVDVAYVGGLYEQHKVTTGTTTGRSVFRIAGEDGGMLAEIVHPWTTTAGTRTGTLIVNDHQGSPIFASTGGSNVTTLGFLPFGKRAGAPATSPLPAALGYTGHIQDDDLGLIDMKNRVYDVGLRRFITRDPAIENRLHPGGLNPYAYALNNPTNRIDRFGLASTKVEKAYIDEVIVTPERIDGTGTGPTTTQTDGGGGNSEGPSPGNVGGGGDGGMSEKDWAEMVVLVLEHGFDTAGKVLPGSKGNACNELGELFGQLGDMGDVKKGLDNKDPMVGLIEAGGNIVGGGMGGMVGFAIMEPLAVGVGTYIGGPLGFVVATGMTGTAAAAGDHVGSNSMGTALAGAYSEISGGFPATQNAIELLEINIVNSYQSGSF
jgi:RHS repeat-associated protein